MRARAILKTEYYGKTIAKVNLLGKGRIDCDRKVAILAQVLSADYWEVQYDCHWFDAQVLVSSVKGIKLTPTLPADYWQTV